MHCDCNGFYASVELIARPDLKDFPVAIGGDPAGRHGIILAKNEHAKKFGIKTAETIWQAKQKCPDLVVLPPSHGKYDYYSRLINDIYLKYTDRVEPFGIDESWLDVTGSMHLFGGSGQAVADRLRAEIKSLFGITISVGVSWNKVFAKIGSDYKKPDATTVIDRSNYKDILYPLPANAMLYVGRATEKALAGMGIKTLGQLAACSESRLANKFGKMGVVMHRYANGLDDGEVGYFIHYSTPKSVGNGSTFRRDLVGINDYKLGLGTLCDSVGYRMRQYNVYTKCVCLSIKSPDFKVITRQKQLAVPTNLADDLYKAALELLHENWDFKDPVRSFRVAAQSLVPASEVEVEQTSLFGEPPLKKDKRVKLEGALDKIRNRYGVHAIEKASVIGNDIGAGRLSMDDGEDFDDIVE